MNEGLLHNRVKHIVQDSRGLLWFSTAGLSRFDGQRFVSFGVNEGLPHRSINYLLETRSGAYWVATNGGGIARFNTAPLDTLNQANKELAAQPVGARFVTYRCGDNAASQRVNVLFEDRTGIIWAGTDNGLFKLEPGQHEFTRVAIEPAIGTDRPVQIWTFAEDESRNLWVGTNFGLLRRLPDGRISACNQSPDGVARTVYTLLFDPQGRLWIGYRNGLVVLRPVPSIEVNVTEKTPWRNLQRPGKSGITLPEMMGSALWLTKADGLAGEDVLALAQTPGGPIWIGSSLGLSNFAEGRLRTYTKEELPLNDGITTLAVDRAGYLWIGTNTAGALRLSLNGFLRYGESDGLKDLYIAGLGEDERGQLYAVTGQWTIYSYDGARFTAVRPNLPARLLLMERRFHFPIVRDHLGEWWIGTPEGVYRFPRVANIQALAHTRPLAVYTERDGLARSDAANIFEDAQGDLWFSVFAPGRDPLTRWERATGRFIRYGPANGLPARSPMSFADDGAGGVWIGFRDGGLVRYAAGQFTVLTETDGLPRGDVSALHRDRHGKLWALIAPDAFGWVENANAPRPRFLSNKSLFEVVDFVSGYAIHEDDAGRLYFFPGRGLARFDPQTSAVTHYGQADGTTNHQLRSAFRTRHGELWFGTEGSLLRLLPTPERQPHAPAIFISGLHVAGIEYTVPPGGAAALRLPDLTLEQSKLDIEYLGLSFGAGELLRFQYKLDGADETWTDASDQRRISYANLAPGRYRFAVRALTPDGLISETDAAIIFTILPPFYLRWWFMVGALALAGAAVYAFERYRVARLLELERVRMRIATDLHDDIGAGLSRIAILSEVAHGRIGTGDLRGREHMTTIAAASRELLDSMSDIVWAINPQKEHLHDLTQRMRRFANDLLAARNIKWRMHSPDNETDLKLSVDIRREVFLIFKESINNLAKHSGATEAVIDLHTEGHWLRLDIQDDGRGFDVATLAAQAWQSDGNGLMSMRERALRLNGELQIISAPGKGTTIVLHVPLLRHWWEKPPQVVDPRRRKIMQEHQTANSPQSWLARLFKRSLSQK